MPVSKLVCALSSGREMDKLLQAKYRDGVESREQPLYTIAEAAYYLGIGRATLQTWFFGRSYWTKSEGEKFWEPVITPADPDLGLLSFFNLSEAHVLAATRYDHKVPFWAVREAIGNVIESSPRASNHPLLSDDFFTNGRLLFVKKISEYVNITNKQLSLEIMDSFLVRVLKDSDGNPFKVYPLRPGEPDDKVISIMAGVSASRPIVDGTRVPVLSIYRRFKAGEEEEFIASDYDIQPAQVRRAISYVERRAA
jgi:uncharacterized protein (DUF433 family)